MQTVFFVVLVGLVGGVAIGLQGPMASLMSQRIGTIESSFILHLGGTVVSFVVLLFMGGGNLGSWRTVPWYALLSGFFGLAVVGTLSYAIPRVGAATTIILIVAGQLLVATVLDHFGLLGTSVRLLDGPRALGIFIVFAGVWLMVR